MKLFVFKCWRCGRIELSDQSQQPYCLSHPSTESPQMMSVFGQLETS